MSLQEQRILAGVEEWERPTQTEGKYTGYKGRAAHKGALDALDAEIEKINELEDRNDRSGSLILFVKTFVKGDKKLLEAAKAVESIHGFFGGLPAGLGEIRNELWKAAAKRASTKMDHDYYQRLAKALHL